MRQRASLAIAGLGLLAACATTGDAPVPPDPVPGPGAVATAEAVATVAETVCLAAQAAGQRLPAYVASRGPAGLGLRPAPPPESGWVTTKAPRVFVGEWQSACFAYAVAPEPGTMATLISTLARPVGSRLEPELRAADGATTRRICRERTRLTVIEGNGPRGLPLVGVGTPPTPRPCDALAPALPRLRTDDRS